MTAAEHQVGMPVERVDAWTKVTGGAAYTADLRIDGEVHAVLVTSSVACGRVRDIDMAAADAADGVLAVITHRNRPAIRPLEPLGGATEQSPLPKYINGDLRPPLDDAQVLYYGQPVALVVAEEREVAREVAANIRVEYSTDDNDLPTLDDLVSGRRSTPAGARGLNGFRPTFLGENRGGEDVLADDDQTTVDAVYTTAPNGHAMMEPHTTIAHWNGNGLVVREPTQWVHGLRNALAHAFDLPYEDVQVQSELIGGAFGSRAPVWPHTLLAVAAAKLVGRPVRLALSRRQNFVLTGHRPQTVQRVRVSATADGRIAAIEHVTTNLSAMSIEYVEQTARSTSAVMYRSPTVHAEQRVADANIPPPTWMRAPGECPGSFAFESAIDELCHELEIDPVDFRRNNDVDHHQVSGLPWSGRHLDECMTLAAERFGWAERPEGGTRRDDGGVIGSGMAGASYHGMRLPAGARVKIGVDGDVVLDVATPEMGTGVTTVLTQVAADVFAVSPEEITVRFGASDAPDNFVAGASASTTSLAEVVVRLGRRVQSQLTKLATSSGGQFEGVGPDQLICSDGFVVDTSSGSRVRYQDVLADAGSSTMEESVTSAETFANLNVSPYSFGSFFCEVAVWPELARLRVERVTAVMDIGTVLNPRTARSQIEGSITMALGMATMEDLGLDSQGRLVAADLGSYHVPVNADLGHVDVAFLDSHDALASAFGARGAGEIGMTGLPAAIANAVFDATGWRCRDLPISSSRLAVARQDQV